MRVELILSSIAAVTILSCCNEKEKKESVPVLELSKGKIEVAGDMASEKISITSNRAWHVEASEPVSWISVDPEQGGQEQDKAAAVEITVGIEENGSLDPRECVLRIVSEDAALPVATIQVVQAGNPNAVVPSTVELSLPEKGASWYCDPAVFSSLGSNPAKANKDHGKRTIIVKAQKPWKASVSPETTASGVVLDRTSGAAGEIELHVTVGANTDFGSRKKLVIEVCSDGELPAKIELSQEKASVLTLEFRSLDRSSAVWAFEETPNTDATKNSGTGTLTVAGYKFGWKATTTCMFEPGTNFGWRVGRGIGDYVEFPAIPGRKLVKVHVIDANAGGVAAVQTAEGTTVEGGTFADYKNIAKTTGAVYNLSGTAAGTAYRLVATANGTLRLTHIELTYE
ncbi:MAG: BACON domain-containing protein [Bacteroidales bacterium]|nr:BACON domain-containing protein [Bacteroidales bacterium]